jgi:Glu-tRNA(Gln) amidotransferase subunit E-like FAD-binding protein
VQSARDALEGQQQQQQQQHGVGESSHADALQASENLMETIKTEHADDMAALAAEQKASLVALAQSEDLLTKVMEEAEKHSAVIAGMEKEHAESIAALMAEHDATKKALEEKTELVAQMAQEEQAKMFAENE